MSLNFNVLSFESLGKKAKGPTRAQEAISEQPSHPWVLLLCTLNFSVGKRASSSSEIISSSNVHFPTNGLVFSLAKLQTVKSCMS